MEYRVSITYDVANARHPNTPYISGTTVARLCAKLDDLATQQPLVHTDARLATIRDHQIAMHCIQTTFTATSIDALLTAATHFLTYPPMRISTNNALVRERLGDHFQQHQYPVRITQIALTTDP